MAVFASSSSAAAAAIAECHSFTLFSFSTSSSVFFFCDPSSSSSGRRFLKSHSFCGQTSSSSSLRFRTQFGYSRNVQQSNKDFSSSHQWRGRRRRRSGFSALASDPNSDEELDNTIQDLDSKQPQVCMSLRIWVCFHMCFVPKPWNSKNPLFYVKILKRKIIIKQSGLREDHANQGSHQPASLISPNALLTLMNVSICYYQVVITLMLLQWLIYFVNLQFIMDVKTHICWTKVSWIVILMLLLFLHSRDMHF